MPRIATLVLAFAAAAAYAPAFDLESIKNEPKVERRSELALANANEAFRAAKDAFQNGDLEKGKAAAEELGLSVEYAYSCLVDGGKNARNSLGSFKKAELSTRQVLRRLEGLIDSVSVDERPPLEGIRARILSIHDSLIVAIMKKK